MTKLHRVLCVQIAVIALAIAPATAFGQAAGPSPADLANATLINVALSSYEFAPANLTLVHGTAYRLHLTNTSGKAHNFSAPQLFAASSIAPLDRAKIENGEIEVDGGQTIDLVFVPMTPGEYDISCTHFLHAMFGMRAKAVVR